MNITRRSLFGALPAIPSLAKHAKAEAERLVGLKTLGPDATSRLYEHGLPSGPREDRSRIMQILDFVTRNGIPKWRVKQLRREASYSRVLDPDVAVLHSVSIGHKLRMQRTLNFSRLVEAETDRMKDRYEASGWRDDTGIDYYGDWF